MSTAPHSAAGLRLDRDAHGRLVLRLADGTAHVGVVPVRAFPLADPEGPLALVGADGRELAWIEQPAAELSPPAHALIDEELASRGFTPVIQQILAVGSFTTPSTWQLLTDRGPAALVLKGEEDIRRLGGDALLITDSHGMPWRIADRWALDKRSRRLLERFL